MLNCGYQVLIERCEGNRKCMTAVRVARRQLENSVEALPTPARPPLARPVTPMVASLAPVDGELGNSLATSECCECIDLSAANHQSLASQTLCLKTGHLLPWLKRPRPSRQATLAENGVPARPGPPSSVRLLCAVLVLTHMGPASAARTSR